MSLSLTVSAITPPDGLAHTDRKTEILQLPLYLRVTAGSAATELKFIYVSATEPDPAYKDNIWLKIDEVGTQHGLYRWDTTTLTWLLMAGPGIYCGTTAPTDTTVLWLKTDSVDAVLTPGSAAVAAPQGLYKFVTTIWTCFTTPTTTVQEVYTQAAAPTGATNKAWIKTADEKGIWYWDGSAWVNAAALGALGSGVAAGYIVTNATAPAAAIRPYCLWAKIGDPPNGLFWPDVSNGRWESINPILISQRYPAGAATVNVPATSLVTEGPVLYSAICPTWGTAVFAAAPMVTVMIEYDSTFSTPASYLSWGVAPIVGSFDIALYNSGAAGRDIAFRVSAVGIVRIPF